MIIYGGENGYNHRMKLRGCFNDVRLYNILNNDWKYLKTSGELLEARRNCVGALVG